MEENKTEEKETEKQVIQNKYLGKGKTGRFCPFRIQHFCNKNCGLFCEGLGSCVLHGLNLNLQLILEEIKNKNKVKI